MLKAVRWSKLLAAAATTVRETSCTVLAEAVKRMATDLACVQSELELRFKINEAAVEVAGLGGLLLQTYTPEELVDGLATEKEEGGNNEERPVPAEVPAGVPTPVVKAAAGELPALGLQAVDVNVKAVGGNKEVPPVPAELSLVVSAAVVKEAAGELQPNVGYRVPRVSSIAVGTNENQIEVRHKNKTDWSR